MRNRDEQPDSNIEMSDVSPLDVSPDLGETAHPKCGPCLSEEQVLAFSEGHLLPSELDWVHAHLDLCPICLELLNAAVHHWDEPPASMDGDRTWMATFGAGQTISGRYEVERFVGRGGMGEVYLVFDCVLRERVALKTLLSTISDNPHAVKRLLSEARLARRISHANVCRVHDVGLHEEPGRVDERLHFLTMEYIDGQRLGQLLRARVLEIPVVLEMARQILLGLAAAHAAGVLHRDLKSDNIMVRGEGHGLRVSITDFGLSRELGSDADHARLGGHDRVGSVSYMAPEQITGGPLSPATDLFAFGVVMYEMLCGLLPFVCEGSTTKETVMRRSCQQPPPPSQLRPDVGPALDRLVLRCLMEKPEDRFASADELRAWLDEAGAPPSATYQRATPGLPALVRQQPSGGAELSGEMRSIWDRSGELGTGNGARGRAS
jgi:serine/threonine protein kinase